jgi:hypothetical protein
MPHSYFPYASTFDALANSFYDLLHMLEYRITFDNAETLAMYTLMIAEILGDAKTLCNPPQKSKALLKTAKGSIPTKDRTKKAH